MVFITGTNTYIFRPNMLFIELLFVVTPNVDLIYVIEVN